MLHNPPASKSKRGRVERPFLYLAYGSHEFF